jgi:hypothetical protein
MQKLGRAMGHGEGKEREVAYAEGKPTDSGAV